MADLLFLPAPEHRGALLDDGVGGARVPTWTICTCERHGQQVQTDGLHPWFCPVCCTDPIDGTTIKGRETALILIWRGQVAQEGCDRLARVLNAHGSRWSFDLRCDYGGSSSCPMRACSVRSSSMVIPRSSRSPGRHRAPKRVDR